jgi:predicted MPP superfamily phosphohydrolase
MQGDFISFAIRVLIILGIALLIDLYFYQAVLGFIREYSPNKKLLFKSIYWSFTLFTVGVMVVGLIWPWPLWPKVARVYISAFIFILFFSKLVGSLFLFMDDLIRLGEWIVSFFRNSGEPTREGRHKFLTSMALIMAGIPFAGMIYGMIKTAFDFTVHRESIKLPNLPASFDGLKIVQISDIHSGSFTSKAPFEKAIKLILEQKPDIIFFTGDLVNNVADEVYDYIDTLSAIKAPMGVYSILGNHDYGDYMAWDSLAEKEKNLDKLKAAHGKIGWNLMLNENVRLKRGDDEIALIGVENWGKGARWPKYGDLKKAIQGVEDMPVKLLLSHDPSHWDAVVREQNPDIDITFSGHTHGFQFGIEIPGIKWSPSQYLYPQWAGLYTKANQHIYVNRGFGFLGYPGRVGIKPEISVIELKRG